MILVDLKGDKKDKHPGLDMLNHIRRSGVSCEPDNLLYADACFEGRGPLGTVCVGIERKALHDMLQCIDDARYTGHQRIGMKQMYAVSVLAIEGHWRPHDGDGHLMEGFNGGVSWGYCKYRSQRTMYAKLYRYLISVALSGVIVTYSRDVQHTAANILEWFHYFQKKWDGHTSLQEMQSLAIPTLNAKPSLVRRWANDLDSIGTKLSEDAEALFKTPIKLATSEETDWLRIRGIGPKTAQEIVRAIWGRK